MQGQLWRTHRNVLLHAGNLLARNLNMFVPIACIWFGTAIVVTALVLLHAYYAAPLAAMIGIVVIAPLVIAYTMGMAGGAWRTGRATFADGAAAYSRSWTSVLGVIVGIGAIEAVLQVLLPNAAKPLADPICAPFLLYTLALVVVGEYPAVEAVVEAVRMASRNLVTTFVIFVLALIGIVMPIFISSLAPPSESPASYGVGLLLLVGMPVLLSVLYVYATLYVTGEYLTQRQSAA